MMSQASTAPTQSNRRVRLGLLLSGRGSNFKAIHQAIESGLATTLKISVVLSNRQAEGIAYAQSQGLPNFTLNLKDFPDREAMDQAIVDILQAHQVDLVILAGYDRIVGTPILQAYPKQILNIHPSLLPAYGGKGMVGLKVHQAVLNNQEAESGCTVHLVTEGVDEGPILAQSPVPVLKEDTAESLAARILKEEHQLYYKTIEAWASQLLDSPPLTSSSCRLQESFLNHDDALV